MADNTEGRSPSSSYLFIGLLEVYKRLLSWFIMFSLFVIFVEHKTCKVSVYHTPVKTAVLWHVMSCIVVYMYQHFTKTCLHLLSWWWEQNIPLKYWYLCIRLHGVRFQKTAILIANLLYEYSAASY